MVSTTTVVSSIQSNIEEEERVNVNTKVEKFTTQEDSQSNNIPSKDQNDHEGSTTEPQSHGKGDDEDAVAEKALLGSGNSAPIQIMIKSKTKNFRKK
jgi:hypothetical protein